MKYTADFLKKELKKFNSYQDFYYSLDFDEYNDKKIKNIIIVQFDGIGDVVSIFGCIDELHKFFPDACITMCCYEKVYDLIKLNKHINEFILFPNYLSEDKYEFVYIIIDKCKDLLLRKNDLGIHFQVNEQNPIGNMILSIVNCKYRFGYPSKHSWLLTNIVPLPVNIHNMVGRYFYLLYFIINFFDIKIDNLNLKNELPLSKEKEIYDICISLSGSLPCKKYPVENLVNIISKINANVVWIGGKTEQTKIKLPGTNLINKLNIVESAKVINSSKLYIGNDTGTSHIAASLNKPAIICSQESKEKTNEFIRRNRIDLSSYLQFHPWYGLNDLPVKTAYETSMKNSYNMCTVLQPDKSLKPCNYRRIAYSGCSIPNKAHCISGILEDTVLNSVLERIKNV